MAAKTDTIKSKMCSVEKKIMKVDQFYKSNNLEKYPDGYLNTCKKCTTMMVNPYDSKTFMNILEECDVPFMPEVWNKVLDTYGNSPKFSGAIAVGRYLGRMHIQQNKDYRWKDTEYLQKRADEKLKEMMVRQGYSAQEIDSTIDAKNTVQAQPASYVPPVQMIAASKIAQEAPQPDYSAEQGYTLYDDSDDDLGSDLTEEDRTRMRLKWGKTYKPEEWVKLETLYQDMMNSYDIQEAGHEDTLKLVCKCSLKSNQLLDIGDVDAAQKMVKMYDGLMKSGKFTAAQNKGEKGQCLDSIAELVSLCEKDGFIPRFYSEKPNDRVDETIYDLQQYTRSLVIDELNLGTLIEGAIRQMHEEEMREEDSQDDEEYEEFTDEYYDTMREQGMTEEEIEEFKEKQKQKRMEKFAKSYSDHNITTDADILAFRDFEEEQINEDVETISKITKGE